MRRTMLAGLSISLMMWSPAYCDEEPPWEELLGQAGLTIERAQLEAGRWRGGSGNMTVGTFERLWDDWTQVRPYGLKIAREATSHTNSAGRVIELGAAQIDAGLEEGRSSGIRRAVVSRVEGECAERMDAGTSSRALVAAIQQVHVQYGMPLDEGAKRKLRQRVDGVPMYMCEAAALVLEAAVVALEHRDTAIAGCGPPEREQQLFDRLATFANWHNLDEETLEQLTELDVGELAVGAVKLGAAVEGCRRLLERAAEESEASDAVSFEWETPMGWVVLDSAGKTRHEERDYLLIIDTAGDDVYSGGGGTRGANNPVSVIVDTQGDDVYRSDGSYCFGAGVMGYGMLVDADGDDRYEHGSHGLGMGAGGFGLVLDEAGDDVYESHHLGQGAGTFGGGALVDLAGADRYVCYTLAQGYGGVRGCGMVIDCGGDDEYAANDEDIQFPSPQTKQHNTSMAQGAGFGRRAHPGDGMSLAGGVGVLVDASGDDTYSCGVFGQGTAYWYSVGMLIDLAGNDKYRGVWYTQGASAHYAVAGFFDEGGNDEHKVEMYTSLAAGHDYGSAVLWDAAGDDEYAGPLTLGWGNANGIGVFVDIGGDDRYDARRLAGTNNSRKGQFGLGLFVDIGGNDELPESDKLAKPGQMWKRREREGGKQWGIGMDR